MLKHVKKFCDFDLKSPNREKMLQLREKIAKSTEIIERDIFFQVKIKQRKEKGENDDFSRKWGAIEGGNRSS